jgi:hypothetical protein
LLNLVRYYRYINNPTKSNVQAVHTFFPSARSLLPTYGMLERPEGGAAERLAYQQNATVLALNQRLHLLRERVPYTLTVAGDQQVTDISLPVSAPHPSDEAWQDGAPRGAGRTLLLGDGTVLSASANLPLTQSRAVVSSHAALPAASVRDLLNALYPNQRIASDQPARQPRKFLWFTLDCPVVATLTLPSGARITSEHDEAREDLGVFTDPSLIWMLVPEEPGDYKLQIEALANTDVRWWQGDEAIHTTHLDQGQVTEASYTVAAARPEPEKAPEPPVLAGGSSGVPPPPRSDVRLRFSQFPQPSVQPYLPWHAVESQVQRAAAIPPSLRETPAPHRLPLFTLVLVCVPVLWRRRDEAQSLPRHPP